MKTSIIILTHNRSQLLEKCLNSLFDQLKKDDEVIVIDNNSCNSERKKNSTVINKYSDNRLKFLFNNINSIALGRNIGITAANKKAQIIAFIDDDCLCGKDWLVNLKKDHFNHPDWKVIQGKIISYPKNNLYSEITNFSYQNWLKSNLENENKLKTIDTKNVSFKANLFFTGFRFENKFEPSDDIELGWRLRKSYIIIYYSKRIKIFHKERETFNEFLKQHLNIARGESKLSIGILPSRYKYHILSFFNFASNLIRKRAFLSLIIFLFLIPTILTIRMGVFLSRPLWYKP